MNWKERLFRQAFKTILSTHLEKYSASLATAFSLPGSNHEECAERRRTPTIDVMIERTSNVSTRVKAFLQ